MRRCMESSQQVLGPREVLSKTVWKEIIMPIAEDENSSVCDNGDEDGNMVSFLLQV